MPSRSSSRRASRRRPSHPPPSPRRGERGEPRSGEGEGMVPLGAFAGLCHDGGGPPPCPLPARERDIAGRGERHHSDGQGEATPLAVYIHWPFCASKCPYCDFNSHVRTSIDEDGWVDGILAELDWVAANQTGSSA